MIPDALTGNKEQAKKELREYLKSRRMCSAENLALRFGSSVGSLQPLLEELRNEKFIRISVRSCGDSCQGCASDCETSSIDSTAIIISMEKNEDDYDDS